MVFDSYNKGNNSGATSLTFNSGNVSGSNRIGVVGVFTSDISVTGVTWDGAAMTLVNGQSNAGLSERVELWYIIAPPTGVKSIVITRTGSYLDLQGYAVSYTEAKQSAQPDASATLLQASGTTLTSSVTTVAQNSLTALFARNPVGNFTASTNTTFRSPQSSVIIADSNTGFSPGSNSMVMTLSDAEAYSVIGSFATYTDSSTLTDTATITDAQLTSISQIIIDTFTVTDVVTLVKDTWKNVVKNVSTFTNTTKNTISATNIAKTVSSWINQSKS